MPWHPKTIQHIAIYSVFSFLSVFPLPEADQNDPKFRFNGLLSSDTQKSSKKRANTTLPRSRCEIVFAPPPAKADIATAILTNVITENEQMWWILILPLHATSCHFKWRTTSSGICHFKWRMPLQVAYATSSGVTLQVACHFKWRMPLQVEWHFEWRMALQVAGVPTSSGVLTV